MTAVSITGMHRSATSMVSHMLSESGLYIGDQLMEPAPDNPDGFWEDVRFVAINEDLLQALGGDWDEPPPKAAKADPPSLAELSDRASELIADFESHGAWGFKDPRTSLTLPFWLGLLPELKVLICVRDPVEVAASLSRRNHSSSVHGLRLWRTYNERLLATAPAERRLVTHYRAYLDDPRSELERVAGFCGLKLDDKTASAAVRVAKPQLRHSRHEGARAKDEIPPPVKELYSELCKEANWKESRRRRPTRDALAAEVEELTDQLAAQSAEAERLAGDRDALAAEREKLLQRVADRDALAEEREKVLARVADRDRLAEQARDLAAQVQKLTGAVAERAADLGQRTAELEVLRTDRQALVREREQLLKRISERDALAKERDALAGEREKLMQRAADRDELATARDDLAKAGEALGRERDELANRLRELTSSLAEHRSRELTTLRSKADSHIAELREDKRTTLEVHERMLQRERQLLRPDAAPQPTVPVSEANAIDALAVARLRAFLQSDAKLTFSRPAKPKVSVVVLSYKRPHLTYLALESLLSNQSEQEFELVVVDNQTTPETRALLERVENAEICFNEENLGFGAGNLLGARVANGEHVCFLNNDTITTPGWLSSLVRVLDEQSDCAAVGGKLIQLGGTLQEAGSILWNDGSCAGYGRGDDPEAEEYGYPRDVDFCSAACLLVRRKVFHDVGGFDKRYEPAYYEDVDLCLSIWEAGHRVAYEPRSRVMHLEYGSSGLEQAWRLHMANRKKFVEKWGSELERQLEPRPSNLLRARDRRTGRRILVVDDRVPDPDLGSGFPRTRALLDALVGHGYVLTYLATAEHRRTSPVRRELESLGVEVITAPSSLDDFVRERAPLYETAIVSRPHNAYLIKVLKEHNAALPVIYDAEAVFAMREVMQRAAEGQPMGPEDVNSLVGEEIGLADGADAVVTVSTREQGAFEAHCKPRTPMLIWGHAITVRETSVPFADRDDLLLVGNFETPPNADALMALVTELLPALRAELECRLLAVGAPPDAEVVDAAAKLGDAVEMTGRVPDLAPTYDRAKVFVAPHRFAGGIPLKVVEAMGHGVPCVVSEVLAEQLGVAHDEQVLVVSEHNSFTQCVTSLYGDPALWERLQRSGYEFVRANFDPDRMGEQLIRTIEELMEAARAHRTAADGNASGPSRASVGAEPGSLGLVR